MLRSWRPPTSSAILGTKAVNKNRQTGTEGITVLPYSDRLDLGLADPKMDNFYPVRRNSQN